MPEERLHAVLKTEGGYHNYTFARKHGALPFLEPTVNPIVSVSAPWGSKPPKSLIWQLQLADVIFPAVAKRKSWANIIWMGGSSLCSVALVRPR